MRGRAALPRRSMAPDDGNEMRQNGSFAAQGFPFLNLKEREAAREYESLPYLANRPILQYYYIVYARIIRSV